MSHLAMGCTNVRICCSAHSGPALAGEQAMKIRMMNRTMTSTMTRVMTCMIDRVMTRVTTGVMTRMMNETYHS